MTKNEIRRELSRLYGQHGGLTAETVVEAARPEESPLHGQFEWDDTEAAHQFRLVQSRSLMRRVGVIIREEVKPLIHVPPETASGVRRGRYLIDEDLVKDVDEYARAIQSAQSDLDAALRRMAQLRKLRPSEDSRFETVIRALEAAKLALVA